MGRWRTLESVGQRVQNVSYIRWISSRDLMYGMMNVANNTVSYTEKLLKDAAAAKSLQSCPTLCNPIDSSPPGSPIPGILQVRILEWVTISFSDAWKRKGKVKSLSCVWLLATPWTAAYQAPPFMGFSRQEYWSGLPLPSPAKRIDLGKKQNGKYMEKTDMVISLKAVIISLCILISKHHVVHLKYMHFLFLKKS